MSTVDKMLISFDPENKHVITFFRPVTLIVGPNGAGKTTIIECLKLACTGELPPNSCFGHIFIHDPKVAGETETKGLIKLRFKTAAGKDVVRIRSFQLTQKASNMEFRPLTLTLRRRFVLAIGAPIWTGRSLHYGGLQGHHGEYHIHAPGQLQLARARSFHFEKEVR